MYLLLNVTVIVCEIAIFFIVYGCRTIIGFFFLLRNDTRPFLLYIGLALMHAPFYILPEFAGQSARGTHYGDALLEMDWTVENIVKAIREIGEEENTLIWVASNMAS